MLNDDTAHLAACHCCGLIQRVPVDVPRDRVAVCARCHTPLRRRYGGRNRWTAALCVSALVLYVPAMLLPMLRIERLGHMNESNLIEGIGALWTNGHWLVATVVFAFSVVVPLFKLSALWVLSSTAVVTGHRHRAVIYRLVDWFGRWGMLDVMLVALLVAFVRLGDLVSISAGPGSLAFSVLVMLSLVASVSFNPVSMWSSRS